MALEDVNDWMARATAVADRAMVNFEQRMGYEPDTQHVRPAGESSLDLSDLPEECRTLFASLDEISWPDIWNGYFIGPASEVIQRFRDHEPDKVMVGADEHRAVAIGSDGGGAYFAIDLDSSYVLRVTQATIDHGTLRGVVEVVAPSLDAFLEALLKNARAFAKGQEPSF